VDLLQLMRDMLLVTVRMPGETGVSEFGFGFGFGFGFSFGFRFRLIRTEFGIWNWIWIWIRIFFFFFFFFFLGFWNWNWNWNSSLVSVLVLVLDFGFGFAVGFDSVFIERVYYFLSFYPFFGFGFRSLVSSHLPPESGAMAEIDMRAAALKNTIRHVDPHSAEYKDMEQFILNSQVTMQFHEFYLSIILQSYS
jgi:hypothetical protein